MRATATTITRTPTRTVNSAPGNKTATGRASPSVPARPTSGRDRLTVDELHSAKTSYIGKKPQLNDSVPMRGAGLGAGPPAGGQAPGRER